MGNFNLFFLSNEQITALCFNKLVLDNAHLIFLTVLLSKYNNVKKNFFLKNSEIKKSKNTIERFKNKWKGFRKVILVIVFIN